jgi:hypothetical protein
LEKDVRAGTFVAAVSKQMECAVACAGDNREARCAINLAKYVRPENLRADGAACILRVWRRGFISMGVQNQRPDHNIDFSRLQTRTNKILTESRYFSKSKIAKISSKLLIEMGATRRNTGMTFGPSREGNL